MTELKTKSVAEHCDFVYELAKISFFYAYIHYTEKNEKNENIIEVIQNHTPLFFHALELSNKADIAALHPDKDVSTLDYRGLMDLGEQRPEWRQLMAQAQEIIDKVTAGEFENTMFSYVKPLAAKQAKHLYSTAVGVAPPAGYNAESLKYDPPAETRPKNYCNYHIANAVAPKSIFDDPRYMPECFMLLMDKSEKEYGFDTLTTGTWLNDNKRWLALFPDEWIDNLSERTENVSWHFGNWGQMVTARGTFNHRAGDYLREHKKMKYAGRSSRCSFANMRKKLTSLLNDLK